MVKPLNREIGSTIQRFNGLTAWPGSRLQIGVAGAEHRGEPRGLFLAPAFLTRLFEVPVTAHNAQCALAVNSLFQPPQGPVN